VRSFFVVLLSPRSDLPPRIEQILKPAHGQALFAQTSMKAFHACVLRRLARLNVHQLDLPFHAPRQKMPAGQFRSVVAADRLRLSTFGYNRLQHSGHSSARKTRVHFQRQTLPGVGIDYTQHPDRPSARDLIMSTCIAPTSGKTGQTWGTPLDRSVPLT
jgi:hypothetical protein